MISAQENYKHKGGIGSLKCAACGHFILPNHIIMSVNEVILIGNLGQDPAIKHTASGVSVSRFSLATNETFKNKAGEAEQRTEWHSVVCFARLAEICGQYLAKGRQVYIEGSIRSRKWDDRDGIERKSYEIVARYMQMLSPSGNDAKPKAGDSNPATRSGEDNPFEGDESGTSDVPF